MVKNNKKPIDPKTEPDSRTNWEKIRETLSGSTENEQEDVPTATRRSALYKIGAGAGAVGLVGAGAVGGYFYARQDDPTAPAVVEEDDEPEPETAEYQDIPGPGTGGGYQVETNTLEEYNPTAWDTISTEDEYEEIEPGAEWYLQEDGTVIGVNEEDQTIRIFSTEEFPDNEEYTELYEELEAE